MHPSNLFAFVRQDLKANEGRSHIQVLLVFFRISQYLRAGGPASRVLSVVPASVYRILGLFLLGIDIPVSTTIGPGLAIHHGVGLVVHNRSVLGNDVVLRQAVTIGARRSGGGAPTVGDGVEFGAGAMALGSISIGAGAKLGAAAVVISDVPPAGVMVGNPGRLI